MFITSVLFHLILYMQVVPNEKELPGLKQDSPPFILIAGELPNYDDIYIVAKGERILNVSGGHLVALRCLVVFIILKSAQIHTFSCRSTLSKSSNHTKFLSMRQNLVLPSAIVCDHDCRRSKNFMRFAIVLVSFAAVFWMSRNAPPKEPAA